MKQLNCLTYALLICIVLLAYPTAYYMSSETIEITVKDKERVTVRRGETINSKFMIFSENEVFKNTDSWLFFKFRSADYQGQLEIGKTYKVKVVGWRIPLFSSYRNIVRIFN